MLQRLRQVREILDHPTNRAHRFAAFAKYLKWNIGRRLLDRADYAIDIAPNARVILSNRENYATLAYTCGLYDYEEMRFLTHYLRPGDVFGDFGANVGVYSALAGSTGARVLAVEPVPDTHARLARTFLLNGVVGEAVQAGLSDVGGKLRFTDSLGGLNHVARPNEKGAIDVDVVTGDDLVRRTDLRPRMLKIDVEGFELPLLRGCTALLEDVQAIIIELNGSGEPYGHSDDDVEALLVGAGFGLFDYLPDSRELRERSGHRTDHFNTLFIKRSALDEVRSRLAPN